MPGGFWTRFEQGQFVKFAQVGDSVEGLVLELTTTDFGGQGDTTPVVRLQGRDGMVRDLTCDKVNLLRMLTDIAPEPGDHLYVRYDGDGPKTPGKNPPKIFTVVATPAAMIQAGNPPNPVPPLQGPNGGPPPAQQGWPPQQAPQPAQGAPAGYPQAPPPQQGWPQGPQQAPQAPPQQGWTQGPPPQQAPQGPPSAQGAPLPQGWPAVPREETGAASDEDQPF